MKQTSRSDIAWMVAAFIMMFIFGLLLAMGITQ